MGKCIYKYRSEIIMENFLLLEGGYLAIGVFALCAAIFVGTRPFVGNGQAWKKTVPFVLITMMEPSYASTASIPLSSYCVPYFLLQSI